ncbi:MAG TPA: hypothetical protein VFQ88_07860 [Nevskiaceae bacterium]|nr:hypothetical protein [Nevskiaceae bacterium]
MNAAPDDGAADVGVVAALHGEARCLMPLPARLGARVRARGLSLYLSGVGPRRAQVAADALLAAGAQGLMSWGTCGALAPQLRAGDLILASLVEGEDGQQWAADSPWRECLRAALPADAKPVSDGVLLSGEQVWTSPEQKARGAERGVAVDMESAAIAACAMHAGVPFLVVRVVADGASRALPPLALDAVDEIGCPRVRSFLRAAIRHPRDLRQLPALAQDFKCATRRLARIAETGWAALASAGGVAA